MFQRMILHSTSNEREFLLLPFCQHLVALSTLKNFFCYSNRFVVVIRPVFFKNKFIYLFTYGCVGSSLLLAGLSLVAASGGYSLLRCAGFSLWWLLFAMEHGL